MASSAPLPDAMPSNWVDRHAPAGLSPWLKLGRFDRPTGIWLLMLPGWQGAALAAAVEHSLPSPVLLAKIFVGAALMRAAGCAYNDIVDRDIDAKVARTANRPIPAGQISVKQAWGFIAACSLLSLVILVTLPPLAVALGIGSLALVAAYPFMKRITWWPQAWLGLTFNWGALLGFACGPVWGQGLAQTLLNVARFPPGYRMYAAQKLFDPGHLTWPAVLLYAAGIFWTLGYDTIYAIQDLEDDALAGVKSSARRLGAKAPQAVAGFYLVSLLLLIAMGLLAKLTVVYFGALALYGFVLMRQARRLRVDDPELALRLFKSNTWAGVILFVAIVGGLHVVLGVQG